MSSLGPSRASRARVPVVRLVPSDGADPEAVLEVVVAEVGAAPVRAAYGDGLIIEVTGLLVDQVGRVLHAAQTVDPLVHFETGAST